MRTMLFFDLPSVTSTDHKEYSKFMKFIKSKGFVEMQESVYTKLSLNESVVDSTLRDIKAKLPKSGVISVLTLTEKQFASIEHILGDPDTDVVVNLERTIIL